MSWCPSPQPRRANILINVSVLRWFFSALAFQVILFGFRFSKISVTRQETKIRLGSCPSANMFSDNYFASAIAANSSSRESRTLVPKRGQGDAKPPPDTQRLRIEWRTPSASQCPAHKTLAHTPNRPSSAADLGHCRVLMHVPRYLDLRPGPALHEPRAGTSKKKPIPRAMLLFTSVFSVSLSSAVCSSEEVPFATRTI